MEESSDDDIEIIATKENHDKILEVHQRYEETKRDLEEIEQKSFTERSQQTLPDINISISKDLTQDMNIRISLPSGSGTNKRKKVADIICIDSDDDSDCESDVKVKLIVSGGKNKKLKTDDSEEKSEQSPAKLSTSELFLIRQLTEAKEASEKNSFKDDLADEDSDKEIESPAVEEERSEVSQCLQFFLRSCERILPRAEFDSVEKKVMKNLSRLDPKFKHDSSLKNLVDLKWALVNTQRDSVYVHVKEVLEELKKYRSDAGSSGDTSEFSDQETVKIKKRVSLTTISSEVPKRGERDEDSRELEGREKTEVGVSERKTASSKHIKKLEAALAACAEQIKKCEEAEIDWERDEDSNFLMADRWKKKYMSIYYKLAEYNGASASLERSSDKRFIFSESKFPVINRKIERFVNKTKSFPDFWDIKSQIEKINQEDGLQLTDMQIHNETEKIFISVGKKLKKRRNIDDGSVMYSYLKPGDSDPAASDPQLESKLNQLGKEAKERIEKVFEEFTEKQAAGVKSNEEESDTENEEEYEEEPEPDDVSLNVESPSEIPQNVVEEEQDDDVIPLRSSSPSSVKSSESIKDLLEDSD